MSYRNTVATKVADFVVGQYVIFPTTGSGTWSGIFEGFGEPLGWYAPKGEVNIMVRHEETGEVFTVRSSRLYSGYMTPVAPEEEPEEPEEPVRRLFEVQMPVKGEVIFTIEAFTEDEAIDLATQEAWGDGELNIEHDYALSTHVVVID